MQFHSRNLIPFTNPAAFWNDRESRFGLYWAWKDLSGLQCLGAIQGTHNNLMTAGLLRWRVSVNGVSYEPNHLRRDFYPYQVVESADYGDARLKVTAWFAAQDALKLRFEMTNRGTEALTVSVELEAPWQPSRPLPNLPIAPWPDFPPPELVQGETTVEESESEKTAELDYEVYFFYADCDLPGWKGMMPGDRDRIAWAIETNAWEQTLEPGQSVSFERALGFGFGKEKAQAKLAEARKGDDLTAREAAYQARLENAPSLPQKYQSEAFEKLYEHSLAGMLLSLTHGEGGFWGHRTVTLAARYRIVGMFFWDTAFTMTGLREFYPEAARDSALAVMENLSEKGEAPHTLTDVTRGGAGQAPVMAWAAWKLHQSAPDQAFLERLYPLLVRWNRYWFTHQISESGLCRWHNAGQSGADNCTRWDPCGTSEEVGNILLSGVESVDLNAYLVLDMRCLAQIAHALGKVEDAESWRQRAEEHSKRMVERFYCQEDALFYDVDTESGEPFTRARVPANFIPLWAGVALPPEEIKRVIETHMLNPDEFWGAYPFPSLAYDDPKYNPSGYWRGRMWPHLVYWMIEALWAHGYERQAEACADRLLQIFQQTPFLHENYPSDGYGIYGLPEYNWSCACVCELLLERYKDPRF